MTEQFKDYKLKHKHNSTLQRLFTSNTILVELLQNIINC